MLERAGRGQRLVGQLPAFTSATQGVTSPWLNRVSCQGFYQAWHPEASASCQRGQMSIGCKRVQSTYQSQRMPVLCLDRAF